MPVVISHNSALELLRAVPPQVRAYPFVRETLAMELISTDSRELRRLDLSEFGVHLDPEKDLRRKEALEHMGWTINTIKLDQTADHRELMRAVALFEDEIPRQSGGPAPAEEVAELHQRLLRATRCGVGLERALFGVPVPHGAVRLHVRG